MTWNKANLKRRTEMKFLTTHHDYVLNQNYDLYLVNSRELHQRLVGTYSEKIPEFKRNIHLFNADIKYFEQTMKLKQLKTGRAENRVSPKSDDLDVEEINGKLVVFSVPHEKEDSFDRVNKEMDATTKTIDNNEFGSLQTEKAAALGYELMPLAVSVKSKEILNKDEKIELLDGFKRMFFVKEIPDQEILVKVYPQLNDKEWINSMIMFNSWKFAGHSTSKVYMDRGFRLSLFYRYGIDFTEFSLVERQNPFAILDVFTDKNPHSTWFNNENAYKDLLFLMNIANYRPTFTYQTRSKTEEIRTGDISHECPYQLSFFQTLWYKELGKLRRLEWQQEEDKNEIVRKPFSFSMIEDFFADETLQKHFVKVMKMQVGGHIQNYLSKHILEPLNQYIEDYYHK